MSHLIIDVMTGEETFRNASAKSYTFLVTADTVEKHIGIAARDCIQGTSQVGRSQLPAFKKMSSEMGAWNFGRYRVVEGAVIKMWGNITRYGKPRGAGVIFLQARANAALLSIGFPLLRIEGKSCYQSALIKGNFDILTSREVAKMQLRTNPGQRIVEPDALKPFEVAVILPAREAKPASKTVTVVTSKAEKKIVFTDTPRKIRLRKPKDAE